AAPRATRRGSGILLGYQALFLVGLVGVWTLTWALELIHRDLVPAPWAVGMEMAGLLTSPTFWESVWQTLAGSVVALMISTVIAVPLGIALGMAPAAYRALQFVIDFGRSFPTVAVLPVVILVLGTTVQM